MTGKIDHVFHLGAIYDLEADPDRARLTNVQGTREAVRLAEAIGARRFHHMSSIAVAGLYRGIFREDMYDEAEALDHPYFSSKHDAEGIVRRECKVPWRIYRPGLVVGDSRTGETDKADGPYYFFKLIQTLRRTMPPWLPAIGLEGGRINLVPVDFVVAALDHLAHADGLDGRCFHLTDPNPERVGDLLARFAEAAHAPPFTMRINAALLNLIPAPVLSGLLALTPVQQIVQAITRDLGLPDGILRFVNYPTRFDCREAERELKPAGIAVPPIADYAWRLWDYWERHLDPDLFVDRSLRGAVAGRVAVVTGGSSGIGRATALRLAEAGATVVIVARDADRLAAAKEEAAGRGLALQTHAADITDPDQCDALAERLRTGFGGADILINNAGRSIRRSVQDSLDRPHDFERLMRVNYFGALNLTLRLLPDMAARRRGHIVNISSIGVLTNAPHFSGYVASKAALEAWTRCAAAEYLDRGVEFTVVNMPLVRTAMTASVHFYEHVPILTPEQASDLVVEAIVRRPTRVATRLGVFGQVFNALSPRAGRIVMNTAFRMFTMATGAQPASEALTPDQAAFAQLLRGIHL